MAEQSQATRGGASTRPVETRVVQEERKGGGPVTEQGRERRELTLNLPMLTINVHAPQRAGNMVGTVAGATRSLLKPERLGRAPLTVAEPRG